MTDELKKLLYNLLAHVDEDCPVEYRSKHLRMCMDEVREALRDYTPSNPW
jgi:hypothetical protein